MFGQQSFNANNQQGFNQNGQQGYQQNFQQQGFQQGGFQQQGQPSFVNQMNPFSQQGNFKFSVYNELYCRAEGTGTFFAKKGTMVADLGDFNYSKRLIGTNSGNIAGQLLNHIARRFTGENIEVMEVKGSGHVFLAEEASHVIIVDLEPQGNDSRLVVESEDLLAFTTQCKYGVSLVPIATLTGGGLFMSALEFNGQGAQVAIKCQGNPLVLTVQNREITVDPDAVVAWTGANPKPMANVNWKTIIGQTSGESYALSFNQPGQTIIVQPNERKSGLTLGVDGNSRDGLGGSLSQQNGTSGGGIGGFLGGIGNFLG